MAELDFRSVRKIAHADWLLKTGKAVMPSWYCMGGNYAFLNDFLNFRVDLNQNKRELDIFVGKCRKIIPSWHINIPFYKNYLSKRAENEYLTGVNMKRNEQARNAKHR